MLHCECAWFRKLKCRCPDTVRYAPAAVGSFHAADRALVDALARQVSAWGGAILDAPREYPQYVPGYYAVSSLIQTESSWRLSICRALDRMRLEVTNIRAPVHKHPALKHHKPLERTSMTLCALREPRYAGRSAPSRYPLCTRAKK